MTAATLAADLIRRHEGLRLTVYDDATGLPLRQGETLEGHPTIGFGRLLTSGRGISAEEADYLLANDLKIAAADAEKYVGKRFWSRLSPARQAVLIDMAHNLGLSRLRKFVRLRFALEAGEYAVAADEMLDSDWADQVGERARTLAAMMKSGEMLKEVT